MKKQVAVPMFALMTVIIVSLACQPVTPSTQAPPVVQVVTQVVTQAPVNVQPSPAVEQPTLAPVQPSAQQFFTEEFDTDTGNWSEVTQKNAESGDLAKIHITQEDGYLSFDLGKELIAYKFYDPYEYENVRIDVRVDNRGVNVNNILLVCRASDEGLYLVNIANSGLFAMYALDGAKGAYTRMADGGSNKIRAGKEANEYSLLCSDRTLTLYINGIETRAYTDNQFVLRKGKIGIGVASEEQIPVKVNFDWVKITQP